MEQTMTMTRRVAETLNRYDAAARYYGDRMAAYERGRVTAVELGRARAAVTRARKDYDWARWNAEVVQFNEPRA